MHRASTFPAIPSATVVGVVVALAGCRASDETQPERPIDVLAAWDGTWRGRFVSYDPQGNELSRIKVRQVYRTIDANTQEVTIRDQMPDGKVIEGRGRNVAELEPDGTIRLRCIVEKSDGSRVEHRGRIITGPGGGKQILWWSNEPGRVESFREWVWGSAQQARYSIHGLGQYGDQVLLMAGEYRRE
ncbi:MAG: hypothetical protein AAF628_26975 [Planctomycetota bacterium]